MKNLFLRALQFAMALTTSFALNAESAIARTECGAKLTGSARGPISVWRAGEAIGFSTSGLAVDADGAPDSYLVNGNGLSYTCDGIVAVVDGVRQTPKSNPAHWNQLCQAAWAKARATGDYSQLAIFGFLANSKNIPLIQKDGDPLPRTAFISATSYAIPGEPNQTQRSYVNATEIPYVVLPTAFIQSNKIRNGGIAVVYWPARGTVAFAVYGDGGDLGEASVRLHQDLGNNPMIISQGVQRAEKGISSKVTTVFFPSIVSHPTADSAAWRAEINVLGEDALKAWGGKERLVSCSK